MDGTPGIKCTYLVFKSHIDMVGTYKYSMST